MWLVVLGDDCDDDDDVLTVALTVSSNLENQKEKIKIHYTQLQKIFSNINRCF